MTTLEKILAGVTSTLAVVEGILPQFLPDKAADLTRIGLRTVGRILASISFLAARKGVLTPEERAQLKADIEAADAEWLAAIEAAENAS